MMKFQYIVAFVTFAAMASSSYGHIGGGSSQQSVNPQVYCGRSLARALALLCFDNEGYEKRSAAGTMYGSMLLPYYKEQELQQAFPWATSSRSRSMPLPSRSKRYPGVVEECCNKPCGLTELISYC